MYNLRIYPITLGCDPEIFFSKDNKVLGAEKILPKNGIKIPNPNSSDSNYGKITIDGVQGELNPLPATCRQVLRSYLSVGIYELSEFLKKEKDVTINFDSVVHVPVEEMKTLSEESQVFGCAPSFNVYTASENIIKVNPKTFLMRSAGGHLHFGFIQRKLVSEYSSYEIFMKNTFKDPENVNRIVRMLDILVGNTSVLLDRNSNAKERRQVYGQAGDFRTPKWGVEYRTLSNFWLRSYPLMSLIFSLGRYAVNIVLNAIGDKSSYEEDILKLIDFEDIKNAINNDDFDLAYKNFNKIKKILIQDIKPTDYCPNDLYPLSKANTMKCFEHFVEKGMDYWFKDDILTHWIKLKNNTNHICELGWENFSDKIIQLDIDKISK